MTYKKTLTILVAIITVFVIGATTLGIFSNDGTGEYVFKSIHGKEVTIYGKGLYKDMSAEVAPQGIAQDYVTLLIAVPLLIVSLFLARKESIKGKYMLAGTLMYFLVTYLFYTVMGMYNKLFLVYVILMGAAFYAFILALLSFNSNRLQRLFKHTTPFKATGGFLVFNSIAIALLWLSVVAPPLLDGTIIPLQVEHYTTLIVQGLDLGILLPGGFICGVLWIRKTHFGYLFAPVYFIFLSLLMTALTGKVIAMFHLGYNVVPVIFIIPVINLVTVISTVAILRNLQEHPSTIKKVIHDKLVYSK